MKGLLVILSSFSGGGKTSIIQKILNKCPDQFAYSISATTRKPRPGEVNGKDYFFLTGKQFRDDIERSVFLEWEKVHGYYYGTPRAYIEKFIDQGKVVLLDIDVNGALKLAQLFRQRTITIFISQPSMNVLVQRLKDRKTDSDTEVDKRLERIPMEMKKSKQFDYVIINDNLEKSADEVIRIVESFNTGD